MKKSLLIAVDFDGTVVEDRYPAIGKPMPFAIETLKMLQADGHRIILWTYRHGKKLDEAVEFLKSQGDLLCRQLLHPEEASHPRAARFMRIYSSMIETLAGFWGEIYQSCRLKSPKGGLKGLWDRLLGG